MKKLIVVFLFISFGLAEWQVREEFSLPRGIQVSDIKVGLDGRTWVLTRSSLSYVDLGKKSINLFSEIEDGRLLALYDEEFLIIGENKRLNILNPDGNIRTLSIDLKNPVQIEAIRMNKRNLIIIGEPQQLTILSDNEIISTLAADFERFSIPPRTDEGNEFTIYTMANNQVYAWTSENLKNLSGFKNRLIYSASEHILDFAIGFDGKVYLLFKDSILILKAGGQRDDKIIIDNIAPDSRVYAYPIDNSILLFNKGEKTIKILSRLSQAKNDIITLGKNRPNPVDNYTEFEFTLKEPMYINFTIYNLIGKPVKVLASGYYNKGTYTIPWHAEDEKGILVPNGVYFYRLETNKGVLIKQLIVLR